MGPLVIVFMGLVMNTTKDFMLETSGRAEALHKLPARVAECLRAPEAAPASELAHPPQSDYLILPERKLEVSDLFNFFFGPRARSVYAITLSPYLYGGLWAHGVVFANSFAANVPVFFMNGGKVCTVKDDGNACLGPFFLWLAVFASLGWPLACCELKEQRNVQMVMFGARIVIVVLLTFTIMLGYGCDGTVFVDADTSGVPIIFGGRPTVALFRISGLARILPVSIYAFIFHHSTPVISQAVGDKSAIPRAFAISFCIVGTAYMTLGVILAAWFGSTVNSQCNLNWQKYVGCVAKKADGSAVTMDDQSWWARMLSFTILVFPALDVLSAFPLSAITLGNNLRSALNPKQSASDIAEGIPPPPRGAMRSAARRVISVFPAAQRGRVRLISFRLLAAVPPLFAAGISTWAGVDLGMIFQYVGSLGIVVALVIPSVLRITSYARHEAVLRSLVESLTVMQAEEQPLSAADASARAATLVADAMRVPLPFMKALRAPHIPALVASPYTGVAIRKMGRYADIGCLIFSFVVFVGIVTYRLLQS